MTASVLPLAPLTMRGLLELEKTAALAVADAAAGRLHEHRPAAFEERVARFELLRDTREGLGSYDTDGRW